MPFVRVMAAVVCGLLTGVPTIGAAWQGDTVLVFAAASLRTALDQVIEPCRRTTGVTMRVSYAGSSALARQIGEGAPADLFISADLDWMDYVEARGLLRAGSRRNLFGNRLVLVAPRREPMALRIGPGFDLVGAIGRHRLALADPATVPAGKYAQAALRSLGVWDTVATRLAPAENVRAALFLVSSGEAPLGVVYRTDAVADPDVVIVDTFAESTHPPIIYPAALTTTAAPRASMVFACLGGEPARAIFEQQGFTTMTGTAR